SEVGDIDVATISGTEYLAFTTFQGGVGNTHLHLVVVRLSDMTVMFDTDVDLGTSTSTFTVPCAFDASGNVWWIPNPGNSGISGSNTLIKVAVPSGSATNYAGIL